MKRNICYHPMVLADLSRKHLYPHGACAMKAYRILDLKEVQVDMSPLTAVTSHLSTLPKARVGPSKGTLGKCLRQGRQFLAERESRTHNSGKFDGFQCCVALYVWVRKGQQKATLIGVTARTSCRRGDTSDKKRLRHIAMLADY